MKGAKVGMHNYLVEGGWNGGLAGDSGGNDVGTKSDRPTLLHKLPRLLLARRRGAMGNCEISLRRQKTTINALLLLEVEQRARR